LTTLAASSSLALPRRPATPRQADGSRRQRVMQPTTFMRALPGNELAFDLLACARLVEVGRAATRPAPNGVA
jgi:hypothetical protein